MALFSNQEEDISIYSVPHEKYVPKSMSVFHHPALIDQNKFYFTKLFLVK